MRFVQERPWKDAGEGMPAVTIITDACGSPARLAAYCISERGVMCCDMGIPDSMLAELAVRSDEQIMAQATSGM